MIVTTTNDGKEMTVKIEDAGKRFAYTLTIVNRENGSIFVDYENSARDCYNLLTIEKDGTITNEVPLVLD